MKRKIITTADGSHTIQLPDWNEQYHSKHGAIQEAYHVFIKHGLSLFPDKEISILEVGFGTGLNAFITFIEAQKKNISIHYTGAELYPVGMEEIKKLNYVTQLKSEPSGQVFLAMHEAPWEEVKKISQGFDLYKKRIDIATIDDESMYDLIYFDAFGARVQPELWTETLFAKMYKAMKKGGVLVTYAAKGSVRRAMQDVGFRVERLEGPPGKREMLRAFK